MVYKTDILNDIVMIDDIEEKVQFNYDSMNDKQKDLFLNYKREIVRESISIDNDCVKLDDCLMQALNNSNIIELDIKKLNSKQTFLLDCCIKELERKIDPDVYNKHKQSLKRKRNNECASKFRKKRRSYEKINEIIRTHLNDLAKQCKGHLKNEQIDEIKQFLNNKNLSITLKYFNEDDFVHHIKQQQQQHNTASSIMSSTISNDSCCSSDSSNDSNSNCSSNLRDNVQKININKEQQQPQPQQPHETTKVYHKIPVNNNNNNQLFTNLNHLATLASSVQQHQQQQQTQYFTPYNFNHATFLQHHLQQQQQNGILGPVILLPNFPLPANEYLLLNTLNNNSRVLTS